MKTYLKKILSVICIVSIIVTSLMIVPEAQAESGQANLTKSDWKSFGITKDEVFDTSVDKTHQTSDTVIGTSFRGKITFSRASGNIWFQYGGTASNTKGIRFQLVNDGIKINDISDGSAEEIGIINHGAYEGINFNGTKFELGIDIWKESETSTTAKMNVFINGKKHNATPYEIDAASGIGKTVSFVVASGNKIAVELEKEVIPELISTDWELCGITKDEVFRSNTYKTYPTSDTVIGTSFRGKITYNRTSGKVWLVYGATNSDGAKGIRLWLKANGNIEIYDIGNSDTPLYTVSPSNFNWTTFNNQDFELGIDIWKESETDVNAKMMCYIDGSPISNEAHVIQNATTNIGKYMYFNVSDSSSSISVKLEKDIAPEGLIQSDWNHFGLLRDIELKMGATGVNASGVCDKTHESVSTVVGTSFRGRVKYNKVAGNENNLWLVYGATNSDGAKGIRVQIMANGQIRFIDIGNNNTQICEFLPSSLENLTTFNNEEFELGIDIWKEADSDTTAKMICYVNGVQCNRYAYEIKNAASNIGNHISFITQGSSSMLINVVEMPKETSPENLTMVDWEDFDITQDTTYTKQNGDADGSHTKMLVQTESVLGTSFRGIITLTESDELEESKISYFCYGATNKSGWDGIRFYLNNGKLKVMCVGINADTGLASTKTIDTIEAQYAGLTSFTDIPFELGVDIWQDGNDIKFNIFFNGEQYNIKHYTWADVADKDYLSNVINLIVQSDSADDSLKVTLPNKVAYQMEQCPVESTFEGTTIRLNDQVVQNTITFSEMKDYHVLCVDENGASATDVSCYTPGDAHPDGEIDVRDLVATVKASQGVKLSTGVAMYAANADESASVDDDDIKFMRNLLLTATTAVSTVASYSLTADKSVMPIGGFSGPYGSLVSDKAYSLISESGVNFISCLADVYVGNGGEADQNVLKNLELATKYNLSVFVSDHSIITSGTSWDAKTLENRIKAYSKYPSFVGLFIKDEPSTTGYGNSATDLLMKYEATSNSINSNTNLSAFVNLLPLRKSLAKDTTLSYTTVYENYLREYCDSYNPKYLSYDHYPFEWGMDAIKGTGYTDGDEDRYFENLAIVRKVAQEKNIPFWTHIQTGNYWEPKQIYSDGPGTTEGQLKWQVNVELAFGAKGIQYFPLVQPEGWEVSQGMWLGTTTNYRHGIIGANGEKTSMYPWVQSMNTQISSIDHVLMNSKSEGVMVTGTYATTNMNVAAAYGMPVLENYNGVVQSISTTGAEYGAIVGCFDYYGKTALYVVNYDVKQSRNVTLNFYGTHEFSVIQQGTKSRMSGESCTLTLDAGDGALLVF